MSNTIAIWEDEENNRNIQFSMEYSVENGSVNIFNVTPTKVSFICPESNTVTRSISVHTDAGRELLANKIKNSGQLDSIATEIASREGMLISA